MCISSLGSQVTLLRGKCTLPRKILYEVILAQFKKCRVTQGASQCPVDGRELTAPAAGELGWRSTQLSRVLATGCSHTPSGHPSDTGWLRGCPTRELVLSTVQVPFNRTAMSKSGFLFVFAHTIHYVGYSPIRNRTHAPTLRAQSLNHGTDKEVLSEAVFQQPICAIPVTTSSSASSLSVTHRSRSKKPTLPLSAPGFLTAWPSTGFQPSHQLGSFILAQQLPSPRFLRNHIISGQSRKSQRRPWEPAQKLPFRILYQEMWIHNDLYHHSQPRRQVA